MKQHSSYVLFFDIPDANHNVYTRDGLDTSHLDKLILDGKIENYEIDEKGLKITHRLDYLKESV